MKIEKRHLNYVLTLIRMRYNHTLDVMANKLGIASAELKAIEAGYKLPPFDFSMRIKSAYDLYFTID